MRRVKLLVAAIVAVIMLMVMAAAPAGAQGYTGWIEHPYPSIGLWYCNWYDGTYWCTGPSGVWFPASPDWYYFKGPGSFRGSGPVLLSFSMLVCYILFNLALEQEARDGDGKNPEEGWWLRHAAHTARNT